MTYSADRWHVEFCKMMKNGENNGEMNDTADVL